MEIWFEPEIRRRQELGTAPKPFPLRAAQVLIYSDDRPNEVRLNEEVRALAEVRLKSGITKKQGESVYVHDVEGVQHILPEDTDPDCGHFTLILIGGSWHGAFDFRYNKRAISDLLSAAEEFFETSVAALAAGRIRAAIDNLFSAAELAAKACVLSSPAEDYATPESHGQVHSRFNWLAKNGAVDTEHRKTFNALRDSRLNARYIRRSEIETPELVATWQSVIRDLISHVRERAAVR